MSALERLDVFYDSEPRSAAMQMAVDEALLQTQDVPALRFYRWRAPALSFGYFGRFADVAENSSRRELVRRWTGGGIVLHGDDVTYSLVVPAADPFFGHSSREIYARVHEAIRNALRALHIEATLSDGSALKISESCFANPVRADLLVRGEKIAGAAQRRTRAGLLHQGSIQVPSLAATFAPAFAANLCATVQRRDLPSAVVNTAEFIRALKYETRAWLTRR